MRLLINSEARKNEIFVKKSPCNNSGETGEVNKKLPNLAPQEHGGNLQIQA